MSCCGLETEKKMVRFLKRSVGMAVKGLLSEDTSHIKPFGIEIFYFASDTSFSDDISTLLTFFWCVMA